MTFSLKRIAAALAGASMIVAPVAASAAPANPAAKLSVATARAGTPSSEKSHFAGIPGTTLINIGILAALVVIVLVATNGSDDNGGSPASP